MDWINTLLFDPTSVAHIVVVYALVIALGVKLGKVKVGGIALGVTLVLFMGIIVGHLFGLAKPGELAVPADTMHFVQEFGLILFVYCIGLQVGPSFVASFRKGGIQMNTLAIGIVLLDVVVMLALYFLLFDTSNKSNLPMMVGVMYGAVTNTPGLGAAQETLKTLFPDGAPAIASGYACAYPLGVIGIILSTISLRYICKINIKEEEKKLKDEQEGNPHAKPQHLVIKVTNRAVTGKTLQELRSFLNREFICSRCITNGEMFIPNRDTKVEMGMEIYVVCAESEADDLTVLLGESLNIDWESIIADSPFISKRILVTQPSMNGKTFGEMHFSSIYGVNVTRVTRQGMDLFADRNLHLQIGDRIMVTGAEENVNHIANVMGNSVKRLDAPNVGAIFFGILLGILVGQLPITIPGMAAPLKLGLAGGPLVVAIIIGAFGYKFKITTYTTTSANLMLREIGLILFLASVGIKAGSTFWNTIVSGDGITYVWTGFLITVIPILIMGIIGRVKYKLNYFTLMGLIAGSNTDPPALGFANQTAGNDAPAVGYSTVYPLTMFLRILVAQVVLLLFCSVA
ncbi:MAG: putative transporter [Bacteroidaceae bacterium]